MGCLQDLEFRHFIKEVLPRFTKDFDLLNDDLSKPQPFGGVTTEIIENFVKVLWFKTKVSVEVWREFLDSYSPEILESSDNYAKSVFYICQKVNDRIENVFECFTCIIATAASTVVYYYRHSKVLLLQYLAPIVTTYFEKQFKMDFYQYGDWRGLSRYLSNQDCLKWYPMKDTQEVIQEAGEFGAEIKRYVNDTPYIGEVEYVVPTFIQNDPICGQLTVDLMRDHFQQYLETTSSTQEIELAMASLDFSQSSEVPDDRVVSASASTSAVGTERLPENEFKYFIERVISHFAEDFNLPNVDRMSPQSFGADERNTEIITNFVKVLWFKTKVSVVVWQKFMCSYSQDILESFNNYIKIAFYICEVIHQRTVNVFECFICIAATVASTVVYYYHHNGVLLLPFLPKILTTFFENVLKISFYEAGGWNWLMRYMSHQDYLKWYPFKNEPEVVNVTGNFAAEIERYVKDTPYFEEVDFVTLTFIKNDPTSNQLTRFFMKEYFLDCLAGTPNPPPYTETSMVNPERSPATAVSADRGASKSATGSECLEDREFGFFIEKVISHFVEDFNLPNADQMPPQSSFDADEKATEMIANFAKVLWFKTKVSILVWQKFMCFYSQDILESANDYVKSVLYICQIVSGRIENVFERFICIVATAASTVVHYYRCNQVPLLMFLSPIVTTYFEKVLKTNFYESGGWNGLLRYISHQDYLKWYPFKNEPEVVNVTGVFAVEIERYVKDTPYFEEVDRVVPSFIQNHPDSDQLTMYLMEKYFPSSLVRTQSPREVVVELPQTASAEVGMDRSASAAVTYTGASTSATGMEFSES